MCGADRRGNCSVMWHVRSRHSALFVDPKTPTGAGDGGVSDCVETSRDGAGNLPRDDAEDLKPLTGEWSTARQGAAKN